MLPKNAPLILSDITRWQDAKQMNTQKLKLRMPKKEITHQVLAGESNSMWHDVCLFCAGGRSEGAQHGRDAHSFCTTHTLTFLFHSPTLSYCALISAAPAFSGLCWDGCRIAESVSSLSQKSAVNRSERSGQRGQVCLTASEETLLWPGGWALQPAVQEGCLHWLAGAAFHRLEPACSVYDASFVSMMNMIVCMSAPQQTKAGISLVETFSQSCLAPSGIIWLLHLTFILLIHIFFLSHPSPCKAKQMDTS
eukprot:1160642-Pelagomonas_calceolata.AAC.4